MRSYYDIIKKPKVLYHASSKRDLQKIEVRAESIRSPEEGPVVFGTPDKAYASCFLLQGTNDSWLIVSQWSNNPDKPGPWNFICSDRERFEDNDHGRTIYLISPEGFTTDPKKGAGIVEWVSRNDVYPIGKLDYDSAFEAMIDNGVQVIFTDIETLKRMRDSDDQGYSIAKELESENKKLGKNYIPIP